MKKILTVAVLGAIILSGWAGFARFYATPAHGTLPVRRVPVVHLPFDSNTIDLQVHNTERAVIVDPGGALGYSMLCSAYMARSRESDDLATALKAESAARRSLQLRKLGNIGAWNKLVQSLLQEHRFKDALTECERAERAGINDDSTTMNHADCLIEIGRYDDAAAVISRHPRAFNDASGKTVVAHLLDVNGHPGQAVNLLQQAVYEVDQNGGMSSDVVAWFHTRLALQLAKAGRHEDSAREFSCAVSMYPRDYKALAGLARLAAQDGRWKEAIDWCNRSDAVAKMPDVRALVADAYAKLGDKEMAERAYGGVAELVGRPSGLNDGLHELAPGAGTHGHRLDRLYANFCADHGRDPEGAYAAALRDFDARHDLYSYDTLAWVCLQTGNKDEARQAIKFALSRHTLDPELLYHAGMIYAAVDQPDIASGYLREALRIDPRFDGIGAPRAKAMLSSLQIQLTH